MVDKINFKGHLTIQALDKAGNVIDQWADNNMIMEKARINMANFIAGMTAGNYINKIVIGTKGHNGDYLTPKTELEGFVSSRTKLFSEELASYFYTVKFKNTNGVNGNLTLVSEDDTGTGESSAISCVVTGSEVVYTFDIPGLNANGTGTTVFTEAALYSNNNIFSMKCFKGKIKDNSVALRIIWKLMF